MKPKEANNALWNAVKPLDHALAGLGPLNYLRAQLQESRLSLFFRGVETPISGDAMMVHKR